MFRNQYLISTKKVEHSFTNFREEKFGNLNLYLESKLAFHSKSFKDLEVGFIGVFFDPLNPNQLEESLLDNFLYPNADLDSFFKIIEKLSGRFIALFKKDESYYITGDFKNSKKIIYSRNNKNRIITSSLELYYYLSNSLPEYDPEVKSFFESKIYFEKQQDWHGNRTIDKNFEKLLPNHLLNLTSGQTSRIPLFVKKMSFEDVFENSYKILKGTYENLANNYKLIQPLTAGWDSRILLGASLSYKGLIKYYVFRREDNASTPDILLSQTIAKELNFNFKVFDVEDFNTDFIELYKQHNLNHNFISKLKDIQFHYDYHREEKKLINISGVCGNLFRYVYGCTDKIIPERHEIYCLSAYGPYSNFTTNEIDKWYDNAKPFAQEFGISLIDLYFIENRLANWGSIYPYEQDIALEEIDPFSNKSLMYPVLLLGKKYRGYGKQQLSWKLLERFDKRLCKYTFNPQKGPLHMFIIKHFETNLLYKKFKFLRSRYF
jgi:hypothetical protein